MEPKKLDRKRSFGTVYGDPNVGFVQDDRYFRHDGTLYEVPATAITQAVASVIGSESAMKDPEASKRAVSEERRVAQSEAMKKVWADRREAARQAAEGSEVATDSAALASHIEEVAGRFSPQP